LEMHFPLFDPVLTSIVSPNMRFTRADMEQAQNIAGLLAHVARRQGQELLQYQDHMLGLLQCLGERDFATLQRSSDPVWWNRVDPQANEDTAPLPDDMKPTWVQPPAGPWSEFDNLKINAAVALMAEVSAFCRIRVPALRSDVAGPLVTRLVGMAELRNWVVNSARLYGCLEAEEPQRVVRLEQTPQNLLFVVENLVSLFHQHVQFWHHYWTAGQANSQASLPIIGTGIMFDAPMDRADRAGLVISYSVNIQELRRLFDPSSDFTNQLDTIKRVEVVPPKSKGFLDEVQKQLRTKFSGV